MIKLSKILLVLVFISMSSLAHAADAKKIKKKRTIKKVCRLFKKGKGVKTCTPPKMNKRKSKCDADNDGISNKDEVKVCKTDPFSEDSDLDGIIDSLELCQLNTDPNKPDGEKPNPETGQCDEAGETSDFNIPSGLRGSISRGSTRYETSCSDCHALNTGLHGEGLDYLRLKTRIEEPPMSLSLEPNEIADLTAFLNSDNCSSNSDPKPTATPEPSATPGATPGPTLEPLPIPPYINCTSEGDTIQFGIPRGIIGNVIDGFWQYRATCTECHSDIRGTNERFLSIKSTINAPPINVTTLSDQEIANITAYLNRSKCENGGPILPIPSPTPTPDTPEGRGEQFFFETCGCHATPSGFRNTKQQDVENAIQTQPQMNQLVISNSEFADLIAYFESL